MNQPPPAYATQSLTIPPLLSQDPHWPLFDLRDVYPLPIQRADHTKLSAFTREVCNSDVSAPAAKWAAEELRATLAIALADKNIAGRDEGMAEVLMRLNAMSDQMSAMTGVIRGLSTTVENNTAATAANTTAIAANTTAIAAHTTAIEGIQAKMRQVEAREANRLLSMSRSPLIPVPTPNGMPLPNGMQLSTWEAINDMTIAQMKEALVAYGLPTTGSEPELATRLYAGLGAMPTRIGLGF